MKKNVFLGLFVVFGIYQQGQAAPTMPLIAPTPPASQALQQQPNMMPQNNTQFAAGTPNSQQPMMPMLQNSPQFTGTPSFQPQPNVMLMPNTPQFAAAPIQPQPNGMPAPQNNPQFAAPPPHDEHTALTHRKVIVKTGNDGTVSRH